jgi:DMSO/TMAO reductase YedYZ molybdopterin-dependent catalytic subunit
MRPPAHSSNEPLEPPTPRWFGFLAGLTAAIVALGVAEFVAGLNRSWRSPVLDVGDRAIDRAPRALKDFAIETFGTKDKPILLASIGLVLVVYAAVIGVVAVRRSVAVGTAGICAFGVVGVLAAAARRSGGSVIDGTPSAVGAAVGAAALWWICRRLGTPADVVEMVDDGEAHTPGVEPAAVGISRRSVLARGGGLLALLAVAGGGAAAIGRAIASRFSAAESRAAVRLPAPIEALAPLPAGASVDVAGMTPFITPNRDFYRIDTALTVPQVPIEGWELRIHGMVDRELRISFDELLGRGLREYDITLTCVSNVVGGELVGNARWLGVRLDELLAEAGVQADADQVVGRSVDGYTCGFPVDAATDGRNAIVAVAMNGEPLPLEHGFPARLVVPGLYGYISATKWLTEIELTTFERFESYWVPRGYADRAPIKLMSRIDSVDGLGTLARNADGLAAIGGVAWAQTIGISAVEVQIDDGPWMPAELGESLGKDTWRQWAYRWTPAAAGRTSIRCRAIDGNGVIQTEERTEPLPDGASGHHQIIVFIQ